MEVHRNEVSVTSSILAAHATYKKDAKLKEDAPSGIAKNTRNIPDDDAAAANIKHPISPAITKTLQDSINSDPTQNNFFDLINNKDAGDKKVTTEDLGILKRLKETIGKMDSSDADKKIITEDSELLKKIKEMIEAINSSEWSLAGIREIINKFSTTNQFDLQAIQGVEQNMKEQNMNLEIGLFSLTRIMEKAREALLNRADTNSDKAAGLLGLLDEQEADNNEKIATQATLEGSDANKYDTPNTTDPNASIALDIEA